MTLNKEGIMSIFEKKYEKMSDSKLYSELALLEKRKGLVEVSLNALSGKLKESQEKEYDNFVKKITAIKEILAKREEKIKEDKLGDLIEEETEKASYLKRSVPIKSTLLPEDTSAASPIDQVEKFIQERKEEKKQEQNTEKTELLEEIDIEFIQQIFEESDQTYRPQAVNKEPAQMTVEQIKAEIRADEEKLVGDDTAESEIQKFLSSGNNHKTMNDEAESDIELTDAEPKKSILETVSALEIKEEQKMEQTVEDIYSEAPVKIFEEVGDVQNLNTDPDDKLTDVLAQTKEDIIKNPVIEYTDTEVLKMKPKDKKREKELMENMKRVVIEKINQESGNINAQHILLNKLTIINNNVSKLA